MSIGRRTRHKCGDVFTLGYKFHSQGFLSSHSPYSIRTIHKRVILSTTSQHLCHSRNITTNYAVFSTTDNRSMPRERSLHAVFTLVHVLCDEVLRQRPLLVGVTTVLYKCNVSMLYGRLGL